MLTPLAVWVPGQGVRIDYSAIIEILIQQLDGERKFYSQVILADVFMKLVQMTKFNNPPLCDG